METGKLGFVQTAVPEGSVAVTAAAAVHETAAAAERMHVQAPLTTFYVRPMTRSPQPLGPLPPPPLLPPMATQVQPAPAQLQAASLQEAPAITLPISALNGKQPLPLLALHIAGGVPLATAQTLKTGGAVMPMGAAMCPSKSPKSVGKHVCQYCGRDCLKPSVLEKHLRCHTGERPYPCTICGVSFKTQSNLYKHKRTQAHARISSESDRGSLSSQDSLHSSRDTCFSSSISLDAQTPDYGSQDGYEFAAKQHLETVAESESVQAHPAQRDTQGSGTVRALQQAAMVGLIAAPVEVQKEVFTSQSNQVEPPGGGGVITAGRDPKRLAVGEGTRPCGGSPLTPNRHLPLQRQEATLSPKSWDSMSISKGKSQSHDSTDSGFSDSGEHHWTSSPGSSPHEHSMESLMESSMEVADPQPVSPVETDQASAGGSKSKVSVQEKKQLEERISKIISKNDALMDDKHLENVRPRKTVLSKQGSIDLPMPYTYKDSFHFEMKSAANTSSSITTPKQASISPGPDRRGIQAFCNSLPSQHAGSLDHTPLTRSSSLPFTASEQQSEIPVMASPHHTDRVTLSRRSSAGHLHSLKLGAQSMDQQGPSHRSLVRQAAVDCLPEVSPTERGSLSSLSSDTDCTDTAGESPTARKCRRKRSQKFDYNKWYVYGDGTFRKLYSTSSEKEPDPSLLKAQKSLTNSLEQHDEREDIQISQVRDLVSGTQVVVSTTNMTVGTMQSILCPSIGPGVGLAPASTTCSDRRHSMNAASYVLLQGAMLKNAGSSQQHTDSRVILSGDVFLPKGSSIDRTNSEVVPQHNTLPSERKKQRTEENVCVVLDSMDTGTREDGVVAYKIGQTDGDVTNGVNQTLAPAGRERSRPRVQRQDSLVYPHITQRQPLQKRHSSPLFAVNVSKPSELIIASSANTTTTTTTTSLLPKSSFLPKYQLKLPQTSGNGESCPRHPAPAPYMRHSFSSSQIFTTCAPRSGHSDSITSFTTLTQSQPITPITHIHSQQSKSNGNTRLNALGLPVPISTWSPSPTAVGGLPHNFSVPALGVACPTQGLRTTSDTSWTPQTLAMVTPGVPGQSYMCKTVLAQDQFGSITAPRHSQSATPVISQNQTAPTGKFCPEQCAKSFADINDTGKPMAGRIQQMAVVTVLAQKPTATPTAVFSTNRLIKSVSGVTLDQTAALLPGQFHSQQVTPLASLNQNTPVVQATVFSGNQPVRDVSVNQTLLPVTLQYQTQQLQPTSSLSQSISAKPIAMLTTSEPVKCTRETPFSQTATATVTVPYQNQHATTAPGLAQKLPVTATTNFSTSQSVKHFTDMSINQTTPVVEQQQGLMAQMEQRGGVRSTRIVSNCQPTRSVREMLFNQAHNAGTVQYHIQQARLAQNVLPNSTIASKEPIKEVTNMAPQQIATPITVQYVLQQASPVTVLSQKSTPITTSSLSQSAHPVTDMALQKAATPATAQYHIQQPTPIAPTQTGTPAIVESHWQPPAVVSSVRAQCQTTMAATGVGNSQTTLPMAVTAVSPAALVAQQLQTTCPTAAQSDPCTSTAAVQNQGSNTSTKAPVQFTINDPESSARVDIDPEVCPTSSSNSKEISKEGEVGQLGGVPQSNTQDTFFMRTPDLQIVMQLISDEQLALMAPQIEAVDYKQGDGYPSGEASKTETSDQPPLVPQGLDVNVCKTNSSNDINSTQGGPILSKIMSANGPIVVAQSSCAKSVDIDTPSIFMSSGLSLPERPCQSQASVMPATAQNMYIPDQAGPMNSRVIDSGIKEKHGVGQRDCIPAQPKLNGKDSTVEQSSMEAHITVHKQRLSAWPTSPTLHNPTMQGCNSKTPEYHPQSSLSGPPISVTTEKAYPPTTQKSLLDKVGASVAYQESHLSGVPVGSTGLVRSGAALRVVDVKPQSPLLSACHTSPPAVHCPSVPHHSPISEKTGSSHNVFLSGTVPCPPHVSSGTTATTQANPLHCQLRGHSIPQDLLGQTISISTGILASKPDQTPPQGMSLTQPSGSPQVQGNGTGLSQLNGSFTVLSNMGEKIHTGTLTHQMVGSGSDLQASQHKSSHIACTSPAPPAQSMGVGNTASQQHPTAGLHKPLCPGGTQDGCNHTHPKEGSGAEAGVPDKTSGEPQQSQHSMGQAERHKPTTECRVEGRGSAGAVDKAQGDVLGMGVEPNQACLQLDRTSRVEKTSCSSPVRTDQGPDNVLSPQTSLLPLVDSASERRGKAPEELQCRMKEEASGRTDTGEEEEEEEKNDNNKRSTGQVGGDMEEGGRQNARGADERMADPQAEEATMKECSLRQEETGSQDPIWSHAVSLPPPPPPPRPPSPSQESPGMLFNLNLQLDTSFSHIPPLHPPSSSLTSTSSITTTTTTSSSSNGSLNPLRTHCPSQPFVQGRSSQTHSRRANLFRCYQEPGEATVSSPETGALTVIAHPTPGLLLAGDLPLHSPSETANHSEAAWRANVLLGHGQQNSSGSTPCLSQPGEMLSVASDSHQHPRLLLRTEAQIDVTGAGSGSRSNGLVPDRSPCQKTRSNATAKTRSNTMGSLSYSLRGARKCMDNEEENSSSSDDEGKLVIELESN